MTMPIHAAAVTVDDVAALRRILGTRLVTPGDPRYDDARAIYNSAFDARPAAIAQVADRIEVAAVLRHVRERHLDVSVRGGGHGVAGHAMCPGVVIDLSLMRGVTVDPVARLAKVQGGALWSDVDGATQEHGLGLPGGRVTHTGVAGLTLGGGQGWLSGKYGLTIDSLAEVELVTADGHTVVASEEREPELFWALRGGGGNFGVVTSFTFRLHPVGPMILGGLLLHPMDRAGEVVHAFRELVRTAPDDLGGGMVFMSAPPAPPVPAELWMRPAVATVLAWFGDRADGEAVLAPVRSAVAPAVDAIGPMPYLALQAMTDEGNVPGNRNYWSAAYVDELPDPLIDLMVDATMRRPSAMSQIILAPMGNAVAAVPQEATAFGYRDARYLFHPLAVWTDPAGDAENAAWVRETVTAATPYTRAGTYLNADADQVSAERVRFAYGAEAYARLVAVKAAWDPDNVFHHNANVPPSLVPGQRG